MKSALLFFLIASGVILFLANFSLGIFEDVFFSPKLIEAPGNVFRQRTTVDFPLREIVQEVFTPPPLRAPAEELPSTLTKSGVFQWTNIHRGENALPPLRQSALLDAIAALKVQDMFDNQYFAHVSPAG